MNSTVIEYRKDKYYPNGIVIGKERTDIVNATPDTIIRVTYPDRVLEAKRSDICKADAPAPLAKKYPLGAFIDSETAYIRVK